MIRTPCLRKIFAGAAVSAAGLLLNPAGPLAATAFTSVAAGDMSADDAILWTRTIDTASGRSRPRSPRSSLPSRSSAKSFSATRAPLIRRAPGRSKSTRLA